MAPDLHLRCVMTLQASLYRMNTPDHLCPFGLKAKSLLEREGYDVDDHLLRSRQETDAFQEEHDVETTPQVFIDGKRVGGYDELRAYFDKEPEGPQGTTYTPVVSIFAVALLCAMGLAWSAHQSVWHLDALRWFAALSMAILGIQKLQDLTSFSNRFITYDLLGMRNVRYAYIYPFVETGAAVLMIAGVLPWLSGPAALAIGSIGAVSVFKAVYLDGRELKCACVGGGSDVPLGFISLTENLVMIAMGVWMITRWLMGV